MSVPLTDIAGCFEGIIPPVVATCSADGTPSVVQLSQVHLIDDDHVALSNQFFSTTIANLAENPVASVLVIDPETFASYKLRLQHVRSESHGEAFDRMHRRIEAIAALTGMAGVFALRAVEVFRVLDCQPVPAGASRCQPQHPRTRAMSDSLVALAGIGAVIGATSGLDELVDAVLTGLEDLFGFTHSLLLVHDEHTGVLYTLASHGYIRQGVGSEVRAGEGVIGMAAAQRAPMRVGNLKRLLAYARSVRRSAEEHGSVSPGPEIPLPGLPDAQSQIAVPMLSGGSLIGVIAVESAAPARFDDLDERVLTVVGQMTAKAIVAERALAGDAEGETVPRPPEVAQPLLPTARSTRLRHYAADGSTFLDDAYLIRGVAGRLLWKLANEHTGTGRTEFTNREARLDPYLQLPEFHDNFESRLTLLKRRLDEHEASVRIESTGRGRFRLLVAGSLQLEGTDN